MEEEQFNELIEKLNDIQSDIPASTDVSEVEHKLDKIIKSLGNIERLLADIASK